MYAFICDRCGAVLKNEDEAIHAKVVFEGADEFLMEKDLCIKCADILYSFLEKRSFLEPMKPKGRKGKGRQKSKATKGKRRKAASSNSRSASTGKQPPDEKQLGKAKKVHPGRPQVVTRDDIPDPPPKPIVPEV